MRKQVKGWSGGPDYYIRVGLSSVLASHRNFAVLQAQISFDISSSKCSFASEVW